MRTNLAERMGPHPRRRAGESLLDDSPLSRLTADGNADLQRRLREMQDLPETPRDQQMENAAPIVSSRRQLLVYTAGALAAGASIATGSAQAEGGTWQYHEHAASRALR